MNETIYLVEQEYYNRLNGSNTGTCGAYARETDAKKAVDNLVWKEVERCIKDNLTYKVEWESEWSTTVTIDDGKTCETYTWFIRDVILHR